MSHPLSSMLEHVDEIAKQNPPQQVVCPTCGERHCHIKHGFYKRYLFTGNDCIKIQRYRCLNSSCPRCTFSCLPHPFLPIIRLPLCVLFAIVDMVENAQATIAGVARACGRTWATVRRALDTGGRLRRWMRSEGAVPCLNPARDWSAFTRAFSFAFFPGRFR